MGIANHPKNVWSGNTFLKMVSKELRFNIVSFGKRRENLLKTVEVGLIGSKLNTFQSSIAENSVIFFHCDSLIWGTGRVTGAFRIGSDEIWPNSLYPFRYPIQIDHLTDNPVHLSNGVYNSNLRKLYGVGWAYKFIFSPKPLPIEIGKTLLADVLSRRPVSRNDFIRVLAAK